MAKNFNFEIFDAEKVQASLKLALTGASGTGKTFTALAVAREMADGDMSKVLVIDTENNTSTKYKDKFPGFKVLSMNDDYDPERYVAALQFAQGKGFEVIIVDSLSHAWAGKGGALEQVDKIAAARYGGNSYGAFSEITPKQNKLIDAILNCQSHLIATMRTKTDYVLEENSKGKKAPKKVGTKPIQRDGMDYEFDVVLNMDQAGKVATVTKTRCSALAEAILEYPGAELGLILKDWLSGVDPTTLPMSRAQFIKEVDHQFGAKPADIKAALEAKGLVFNEQDAPALLSVVEEYMMSLAADDLPVEEDEKIAA